MKKKKISLLVPLSKCCLKKFYDLDIISKYGSIFIISIILLSQVFNIVIGYNYKMSFFSMIINTFFLVVVLVKLDIIKINILVKYINSILNFMIVIFILNFFGYLLSDTQIHNYFFAPLSFLGAYCIFLLKIR